jgi:uncharacterized protein YndB with AHSA1/START domain
MTSVTVVRHIRARPSIVFEALVTAEGVSRWWGPDAGPVLVAEIDARIGGRFRVRFRRLEGSEHESTGTFLEIVPPERVKMSWRWTGGVEDPGESMLEIVLRAVDGGTEVTLTHALLDNAETAKSHGDGWAGALDKLAAHFA